MVNVSFNVDYHTRWGEVLVVVYRFQSTGCPPQEGVCRLATADGQCWTGGMSFGEAGELTYTYRVERGEEVVATERGLPHRLTLQSAGEGYELADCWNEGRIPGVLSRLPGRVHPAALSPGDGTLFCLTAPDLPPGETWGLLGSLPALGGWDVASVRRMVPSGSNYWSFFLPATETTRDYEYKYVRVKADGTVVWESGFNRKAAATRHRCRRDDFWFDSGGFLPRLAGVVVPVFSLRSGHSCGIGDFGDLRRFVGWVAQTGMKAIQILPVNDTTNSHTWRDSYPYNSVSVFAFHPIYMDIEALADDEMREEYEALGATRSRLEALDAVDYEAVMAVKLPFIRLCFERRGEEVMASDAYRCFYRDNADWLKPYAAFCCLRDETGTADFRQWGDWAGYDVLRVDERRAHDPSFCHEFDFYLYMQFKLHEQMSAVHVEAQRRGVLLKGDIPIGVSRNSVAAWVDGRLFHFDGQAGAPPDDFARDGQNWGFPTYDWEQMAAEDYGWWKSRLRHMSRYFDAYRIDHVLGFFRIWEIPYRHLYGLLGHFRPALPFSIAELEKAGFHFTLMMAVPHFAESELEQRIGREAMATCFMEDADGWLPRPQYATQRAVAKGVADKGLRDELMSLLADVLFVEDGERPGYYHPRVAAQQTRAYAALDDGQKRAFDRLYADFFYERHNALWRDEALRKLRPIVASTDMLPCAEDLGMVPAPVKGVLGDLEILSLEIERMPKEAGRLFGRTEGYPYLSVATISTHDMPPLRLWWNESPATAQAYWDKVLGHPGTAPEWPDGRTCEAVVVRHLASPSMLCLLAIQDWLSLDETLRSPHPEEEQINNPANAAHYWRYRVHLSVEQLQAADGLNAKLRELIVASGR